MTNDVETKEKLNEWPPVAPAPFEGLVQHGEEEAELFIDGLNAMGDFPVVERGVVAVRPETEERMIATHSLRISNVIVEWKDKCYLVNVTETRTEKGIDMLVTWPNDDMPVLEGEGEHRHMANIIMGRCHAFGMCTPSRNPITGR